MPYSHPHPAPECLSDFRRRLEAHVESEEGAERAHREQLLALLDAIDKDLQALKTGFTARFVALENEVKKLGAAIGAADNR